MRTELRLVPSPNPGQAHPSRELTPLVVPGLAPVPVILPVPDRAIKREPAVVAEAAALAPALAILPALALAVAAGPVEVISLALVQGTLTVLVQAINPAVVAGIRSRSATNSS